MIGIIGSGFGLYGYLPAVIEATNEKVALLRKSVDVFQGRQELHFCKERIVWIEELDELFSKVHTIIFSVPPDIQEKYIQQTSGRENINRFVLEKPVATSPAAAKKALMILAAKNKRIHIGYTFQFTGWGKHLINELEDSGDEIERVTIDWRFTAHHYKNNLANWKRYHSKGGGAIRFYGIHLIALLEQLGYKSLNHSVSEGFSDDDVFAWEAVFRETGLPDFYIWLNSCAKDQKFSLMINYRSETNRKTYSTTFSDPFGGNSLDKGDARIAVLKQLFASSFNEDDFGCLNHYFGVNQLWDEIEQKTIYRINQSKISSN